MSVSMGGADGPMRPAVHTWRNALLPLAALMLSGCAHLDAVQAYGLASSRDASYAAAGAAYRDSAVTLAPYLLATTTPPPPATQPAARGRQVRAALELRTALGAYFATLARLAGAAGAAPAGQIDRIGKNLAGLSSTDGLGRTQVGAAADLLQQLVSAAMLPAQTASVRRLVEQAGPSAMALVDALREVLATWRNQVDSDRAEVLGTLEALAAASDATPLAALLARDRAAELGRSYAAELRSLGTADLALRRIAAGHGELIQHLDDLSARALADRLAAVVTDLQALDLVAELEAP